MKIKSWNVSEVYAEEYQIKLIFFRIYVITDRNKIAESLYANLDQINDKKYDFEMGCNGVERILKLGIAFSGKIGLKEGYRVWVR